MHFQDDNTLAPLVWPPYQIPGGGLLRLNCYHVRKRQTRNLQFFCCFKLYSLFRLFKIKLNAKEIKYQNYVLVTEK